MANGNSKIKRAQGGGKPGLCNCAQCIERWREIARINRERLAGGAK